MAFKQLKLWFDKDCAILLSNKIIEIGMAFDQTSFVNQVDEGVQTLELKDRVELMCDLLDDHLAGNYNEKVKVLLNILGPENTEETGMFTNFYWVMPIAKFVEKYGLEYFDESMLAIAEITKRNTGEFTIRPFVDRYPKKCFNQMKKWAKSDNLHLRRLSSEGLRPRLPWAKKFQQFIDNPSPVLTILELLKDDTSKFVQNSVANTLNDILKDNEEIALSTIDNWKQDPSFERAWIIRHAIRNYRKKKVDWALELTEEMKLIT